MNSVIEDKNFVQSLEFLYQVDFNVYLNLKRNAFAIYEMKLATDAERAFFSGTVDEYKCYAPFSENVPEFKEYCKIANAAGTPYLFIRNDHLYSAIYCINSMGIIIYRKHIYSTHDMTDIFCRFEDILEPCTTSQALKQYVLKLAN